MKRQHIDAALVALLGLLALAGVLHSATGGEQVGVVLLAIVLSSPFPRAGRPAQSWQALMPQYELNGPRLPCQVPDEIKAH